MRFLSSRTATTTIPIWSCCTNDKWPKSPLLSAMATTAAPKPISMSPFLGVRFCSGSTVSTTSSEGSSSAMTKSPQVSNTPTNALQQQVTVQIVQGLPHLTVPLPSRNEPCIFVLKPVSHTIGDLIMMLKTEDPGIDRVIIRSVEGVRIASTTSIQTLMKSDFDLVINDLSHRVQPPPFDVGAGLVNIDEEEVKRMGDVRALVGQLYEVCVTNSQMAKGSIATNSTFFRLCMSKNFKLSKSKGWFANWNRCAMK